MLINIFQNYYSVTKNIKFPLPLMSFIIRKIRLFYYKDYIDDNISLLKDTIKKQYKNNGMSNEGSNSLFYKKLSQFILSFIKKMNLQASVFRYSQMKNDEKYSFMLEVLYQMGADYLSQESLMLVMKILDMKIFQNNLTPESSLMIFLKEKYFKSNLSFDCTMHLDA